MVEHLRAPIKGANGGDPAPDDSEIEGGDQRAPDGARQHGVTAGEHGGEDDSPPQRDRRVGRTTDENGAAADGPCRRQDVAACRDRERRGRRPAEDGACGARRQAVGQNPIRWVASLRRRP